MPEYVRRVVDTELDELLSVLPAISIEGPKAVGKTETARRRAKSVLRLDEAAQRDVVDADPAVVATSGSPVLIDEWQRLPIVWDVVRRAVDDEPRPGRFLLTGSASPLDQPTHSGAGRIVTVRMRPMTLLERRVVDEPTVSLSRLLAGDRPDVGGSTEIGLGDYAGEIIASGFPGMRGSTGRALRAQLDGYLERIAERDFEAMGHRVRNPALLRRWLVAYAAATATTATYEAIRGAATSGEGEKPSRGATQPYRDVLERLWIVEPVPAWLPTRSTITRLSAPPKHHLADPALAARLLGADMGALLDGAESPSPRHGSMLGQLFESLVTLHVRVFAQAAESAVRHLRTRAGDREVDLIVERGDHRVVAVEVKLGQRVTDDDVKHLVWLRQAMGDDLLDAIIVTTGPTAYRRRDDIAVVPLALLGP